MKLAWSIGHDIAHRGAYSKVLNEPEHFMAIDVVKRGCKIIKALELEIDVYVPNFHIPNQATKSAGKVLREKIRLINDWEADLAIESHFNSAFYKARGCETLYFSLPGWNRFSPKGKKAAQLIQDQTLRLLNSVEDREVKDRGAKGMADIRRVYNGKETFPRFAFLLQTKMPAVILEPLFLSNSEDMLYMTEDHRKFEITRLAMGAVTGIIKWCKHYDMPIGRTDHV
jgi:hypothetical protein